MRTKTKKVFLSSAVVIIALVVTIVTPLSVIARSVKVSASRDDVYNQLLEASRINVVANTLKKCLGSIESGGISVSDVKKADIFSGYTNVTTALWVEDKIQGNGGDDGAIWCKQDGGGKNILQLFASYTEMSIAEVVCNGGSHGILHRAKGNWWDGYSKADEDKNCSSFNDSGAMYIKSPDATEQFKAMYNRWYNSKKSENPYLPTYDEIGKFNNVDGYFNYITDFNLKCDADRVTFKNKESSTDYYKITEYDKDGNKITAQNYYYHVQKNNTWKNSLSTDNVVNSCKSALSRISALQSASNGIPVKDRSGGYGSIILADLNDACKNAKTTEGNNGWSELKAKLQEIVDDPESNEEAVNDATANIAKINNIISSNGYVESSGSEDGEGGKVYQCADIDGLVINVEDYETVITEDIVGVVDGGKEEAANCLNSGAGASLGWILCPVLNWIGEETESLYNNSVKPNLEIQPVLFNNGDGGTKQGWNNFQAIANTMFIILFLVIVFSQITGVGIDNYGIKRILPKLIVMAILVNLSYYICLLFIDASNIIGNSIQSMFDGFGESLTISSEFNVSGAGVGTTLASVGLLAAAVGVGGWVIWTNPAILLPLLVGALGILISIVFLFILLSARQAAVVVLTVLSPIAFVCYVLPNTKKFFDRWLSIFQGLLFVYPICSFLVAGGNYVSKLLLSSGFASDGFAKGLTAMVVGIVPIFFIPTVLRGSFNAMGNLGAKISGFGDRMRGGSNRAIRNSNAYKNAQERGLERGTRIRAGLDKNGNPIEGMNRFQRFMRGGNRNIARSRSQYLKDQDSRRRENDLMGVGYVAAAASMRSKVDDSKVDAYGSLLDLGEAKYRDENGTEISVNTNDIKSLGGYHAQALKDYHNATSEEERSDAMARIRAAQNIMSKTDPGRGKIQQNFESAISGGYTGGLSGAASHLMSAYGDKYKSVNRGAHAMISDLATGVDMNKINQNIAGHVYNRKGTDKYTEESLAGADDEALTRMVQSMDTMSEAERSDIQSTATRALEKAQNGNLYMKPEVEKQIRQIAEYRGINGGEIEGQISIDEYMGAAGAHRADSGEIEGQMSLEGDVDLRTGSDRRQGGDSGGDMRRPPVAPPPNTPPAPPSTPPPASE